MAETTPNGSDSGLVVQRQSVPRIVISNSDQAAIDRVRDTAELIRGLENPKNADGKHGGVLSVAQRVNALLRTPPRQNVIATETPRLDDTDNGYEDGPFEPTASSLNSLATDVTVDAASVGATMPVAAPTSSVASATGQMPAVDYAALVAATKQGASEPEENAVVGGAEVESMPSVISKLSDPRWGPLLKRSFTAYLGGQSRISPMQLARKMLSNPSFSVLNTTQPSQLMDSARKLLDLCVKSAMELCHEDTSTGQLYGDVVLSDTVSARMVLVQNKNIVLGKHQLPVTSMAVILNTPLFNVNIGDGKKADVDTVRFENYIAPLEMLLAKEVKRDGETAAPETDENEERNSDLKLWYESGSLREAQSEVIGTNPIVSYRTGTAAIQEVIKPDAVSTWIVMRWLAEILSEK